MSSIWQPVVLNKLELLNSIYRHLQRLPGQPYSVKHADRRIDCNNAPHNL
jgi:hypothetical protein